MKGEFMVNAKLVMGILTALFIIGFLFLPLNQYGSSTGQFIIGGAVILGILWVIVFKWL